MTSAHPLSDAPPERPTPLTAAYTEHLRDTFLSGLSALASHQHALMQTLPSCHGVELADLAACQGQLAALTRRLEHTRSLEAFAETAAAFTAPPPVLHTMKRRFAPRRGLTLLARRGAWLGIALTVTTFIALIASGMTDVLPPLTALLGAVCSFTVFLVGIATELWADTRLRRHADLHQRCDTLEAAYHRVNTDLVRLKCAVIAARQ
ncbi:hypothetical protein [Pandoraea oxalativorans]|nr:hypothetical protein [Pandoraea oxalativorans]